MILFIEETLVASTNRNNFGLDEALSPENRKWQLTTRPPHSPEKSESRATTGDTG